MSVQPLGVILAGGRSSRFGSDKALAPVRGRAMLDRVADRLRPQCGEPIVVGRDWPGLRRIDDRPGPDLGPLGGLAGALAYARSIGRPLVLTSGCDIPELPLDLESRLSPADAVLDGQPTIGLWRSSHAMVLVDWIGRNDRRSIHAWVSDIGARRVACEPLVNVNRPEDLARLRPPADPRSSR